MPNKTNGAVKTDTRSQEMNQFMVWVNRLGIYVVVAMLLIAGYAVAPQKFFTFDNLNSVLQAVSLTGICAVGLAFIVYSANFNDMSLPMTIAFSGMVSVQLLQFSFALSLIGGIAAGLLMGVVNGFVIGKLRAHPIIWSMAFNFVMSGIVRWAWAGNQIYPDVITENEETANKFYALARTYFGEDWGLQIPLMVVVMIVLFIVGHFILTNTTFGNQLKIIGSNYEVGRLSGINCARVVFTAYMINAFCASICGIFLAAMANLGAVFTMGMHTFSGMSWGPSILIAVALATLAGLFNGIMISKAKIHSFIATLGMQFVLKGVMYIYSKGAEISDKGDFAFADQLNKWLKPLPITPKILIMLVMVIVVAVLMRHTRFGRNIYMLGGNAETAWLAGIKSDRYTILIFAFSGACSALGGALFAIAQSSALPNMGEKGISPLLVALAATIIGGTDTNGGRGSVWNTFVAVLGLMAMSFVLSNIFGKFEVQILGNGLILAVCVFYETITAYYNNKKIGIRQPLLEKREAELRSVK